MKNLKWVVFILVAVMLVAVPLIGSCATEEAPPEVIHLTYGAQFSPPHPMAEAELAWIAKIEEETDGRVDITPFWGGSLVSFTEAYAEVAQGVADIAFFVPGYQSSGFEIWNHTSLLTCGIDNFEDQHQITLDIFSEIPEVRAEFADVKLFEESATMSGPWQVLTRDKPIYTLEDFANLQLRTTSMWVPVCEALGAVPIPMPAGDVYISLQKGTIDGAFGIIDQLKSLNLAEVVNYLTILNFYGSLTNYLIMNWDTWNSLPTEIQQVFEDNAEFWSSDMHERLEVGDIEGRELGEQYGVQFIEMSPAELDRFNEVCLTVASEQAAGLDDLGYPGTEIFNKVRLMVKEYTQ
jgi:TRAP-type C4-dicarboxylate transport system substrate-binding protein